MRIGRPDDFATIAREVANLLTHSTELEADRGRLEAELQEALARDEAHFVESEALSLRRELATVEEQRDLVADRIAAMKAKLPSEDRRKAAGTEARKLSKDVDAAAHRFGEAWDRYVDAIAVAEAAAGEVSAARAEARGLLVRLEDLVARFGLDVAMPRPPEGSGAKVAWLAGTLIAQTALGEPDDVVVRDLNAARHKLAAAG